MGASPRVGRWFCIAVGTLEHLILDSIWWYGRLARLASHDSESAWHDLRRTGVNCTPEAFSVPLCGSYVSPMQHDHGISPDGSAAQDPHFGVARTAGVYAGVVSLFFPLPLSRRVLMLFVALEEGRLTTSASTMCADDAARMHGREVKGISAPVVMLSTPRTAAAQVQRSYHLLPWCNSSDSMGDCCIYRGWGAAAKQTLVVYKAATHCA